MLHETSVETKAEALLKRALPYLQSFIDHLKNSKKTKLTKQGLINDLINDIIFIREEEKSEDKVPYYASLERARKIRFGEYEKENRQLRKELDEALKTIKTLENQINKEPQQ